MRRALARSAVRAFAHRSSQCLVAAPLTLAATSTFSPVRRYATHGELRDALLSEQQDEESRTKVEQPQIPSGFTVSRPSASRFTLNRKFSDESIEVQCQLMEPAQTEEGEEKAKMTAVITKGSEAVRFELAAVENELVILAAAHYKDAAVARDWSPKGAADRDTKYAGPAIHQLDEGVTNGFVNYLEERGINDSFAEFIVQYAFWLEQQEYENWLGCMSKFVS
jgi:hypothetical protein